MKLSGSYQINLEKQKVWEALNDPEVLKKAIPGCEEFIKNSDTEFTAKATKQLGVDKLRKMMKSAEAEYDNSMAVQDSQMESGQPMMANGGLLSANKYNI